MRLENDAGSCETLHHILVMLSIPYFMFVIVEMILSFVGFAQLKKAASTPSV